MSAASSPQRPRVVVGMLTYLRPDDLPEAVDSVLESVAELSCPAEVLVVDNDPAGSAMPLAQRWQSDPVRFVHEPTPGIAAARNRALDEAADADVLVFIDDDERPHDGWLRSLLETWEHSGAAAVVGPVLSDFPSEPDPWLVAGDFFGRRRMPTGTEVPMAATNNLLLDLAHVRTHGLRFDLAFGIAGGSDSLFTAQLHRAGGRIVWCDEAVVTDVVPPDRLTREWVIRRAHRLGNSSSRVALALGGGGWQLATRLRLTVAGLARLAVGTVRMWFGVVTSSDTHRARGTRLAARGSGMAGGAWGYVYAEYRRPKPSR